MKKLLLLISVACILCNCCGKDEKAPQFSLESVATINLPQYNIVSSYVGDMGQNVYNLEWVSLLTKQDSINMFSSLSDFYLDNDGKYFKCYAEGDSSICINFNTLGLTITKEETSMFRPIVDEINKESGANIPNSVKPLLYKAYYGFQDSSYDIGFDKCFISDSTYSSIVEWASSTNSVPSVDEYGAFVQVTEDSINHTPIIIIHYNQH